jgi:hypothetical protein
VRRSILPYTRPDWNDTPVDKECANGFKYPAGGTNISSKMPHQMPLLTKHHKYITTSRKASQNQQQQHNTLLRETRTTSEEIQNRIQNKLVYNSKTNLKPRLSIYSR